MIFLPFKTYFWVFNASHLTILCRRLANLYPLFNPVCFFFIPWHTIVELLCTERINHHFVTESRKAFISSFLRITWSFLYQNIIAEIWIAFKYEILFILCYNGDKFIYLPVKVNIKMMKDIKMFILTTARTTPKTSLALSRLIAKKYENWQ